MTEGNEESQDWLWDKAERETNQVEQRLRAELDKWPLIHFLTRHFGSLLFGASQKLINKAAKVERTTARDQAVMLTCARLFSECFAGYGLVRKGLTLQAIVLLRSAFEIATQGLLFLKDPEQAEKWLAGKKIKPEVVRDLIAMPQTERDLYNKLANLAHPNHEALSYFSVPVPHSKGLAAAYLYGGWFAPREAGQIATQFLWAQLVYLEAFYSTYSVELEEHGLLWSPGIAQSVPSGQKFDYTWAQYLSGWRRGLINLMTEHERNTPLDLVDMALALSDYTPEQKEQWRKAFEEISSSRAS